MDLKYLFRRRRTEQEMASAATSEEARDAHEELARRYGDRIRKLIRQVQDQTR